MIAIGYALAVGIPLVVLFASIRAHRRERS